MQEVYEMRVQSLGQENPWRRAWQPTPIFLPGESHGQRSLAGYSPQCLKELDMTHVTTHTMLIILNNNNNNDVMSEVEFMQ